MTLLRPSDIAKQAGRAPTYTMLSDPGHRVIDRYGLLNPASVVRWKFTEVNSKIRPTNEMILAALGKVVAGALV